MSMPKVTRRAFIKDAVAIGAVGITLGINGVAAVKTTDSSDIWPSVFPARQVRRGELFTDKARDTFGIRMTEWLRGAGILETPMSEIQKALRFRSSGQKVICLWMDVEKNEPFQRHTVSKCRQATFVRHDEHERPVVWVTLEDLQKLL